MNIAVWAIALGIAVMILAVSVLTGFQKQITEKVIGFAGHIQINAYSANNSLEPNPINIDSVHLDEIKKIQGIKNCQVFATKAGIIKTQEAIEGVVLKGIAADYDQTFFKNNLIAGTTIDCNDSNRKLDILISKKIANKLKFKCGDKLLMYFIQQPPRMRKFNIVGIYESGMEDFDDKYVLCNLQQLQKLNDWNSEQIGGIEVSVKNFNQLEALGEKVYS